MLFSVHIVACSDRVHDHRLTALPRACETASDEDKHRVRTQFVQIPGLWFKNCSFHLDGSFAYVTNPKSRRPCGTTAMLQTCAAIVMLVPWSLCPKGYESCRLAGALFCCQFLGETSANSTARLPRGRPCISRHS